MQKPAQEFLAALDRDEACLHPTDSLPGLAFHPRLGKGLELIQTFKGRAESKPFIGLVPNLKTAALFWQALPAAWLQLLSDVWPGPLSCVWRASRKAPAALCDEKHGTLALRVPRLEPDFWLLDVLRALPFPLPSTSVNRTGEAPAADWAAAVTAVAGRPGFYVPQNFAAIACGKPSTVIRIEEDYSYQVLREGGVPSEKIRRLWEKYFDS